VELLDPNDYNVHTFFTEPQLGGDWNFVGDIPDSISTGTYKLAVTCFSDAGGIKYMPAQVQVVDASGLVALGDSFSAGQGTMNYIGDSGACHRSTLAYPFYVASQRNLGVPAFAACSGAYTADFYESNPAHQGEAPQKDWLTNSTTAVTLTMGGNDVGSSAVVKECVTHPGHTGWGCKYNYPMVNTLYQRIGALAGSGFATGDDGRQITPLKQLYKDIAAKAPNAKIFVGGYPKLFGDNTGHFDANASAPGGFACLLTPGPGVTIDYDDAQWLNQVSVDLNATISSAVDAARAEGANVYFVPAVLFSGHGHCDLNEEWFTFVLLTDDLPPVAKPESLHPTAVGQSVGYGNAFVSVMNFIG